MSSRFHCGWCLNLISVFPIFYLLPVFFLSILFLFHFPARALREENKEKGKIKETGKKIERHAKPAVKDIRANLPQESFLSISFPAFFHSFLGGERIYVKKRTKEIPFLAYFLSPPFFQHLFLYQHARH